MSYIFSLAPVGFVGSGPQHHPQPHIQHHFVFSLSSCPPSPPPPTTSLPPPPPSPPPTTLGGSWNRDVRSTGYLYEFYTHQQVNYYEHDKYNIHLGHYNPAAGPPWGSWSSWLLSALLCRLMLALQTPRRDISPQPGEGHRNKEEVDTVPMDLVQIRASGLGRRSSSPLPPPVEKTQSMSITIIHLDKSTWDVKFFTSKV